jgi:hypothetical protein
MDLDRFEHLAGAWGGRIARWPQESQDAAFALLAREAAACEAILADALITDEWLDAMPAAQVGAALRDAVLATAPRERVRPLSRVHRWLIGTGVGIGLATACVAGLLVGARLAPGEAPGGAEAMLANLYADDGWAEPDPESRS